MFLTAETGTVPNALLHNLKHNKVLHAQNLFVTVRHHETPGFPCKQRLEVEDLGHDCWQVVINYGFKNDPSVPKALSLMRGEGCQLDDMTTSYFLSRDTVIPTGGGMAFWRESCLPRCTKCQRRSRLPEHPQQRGGGSWAPRSKSDAFGIALYEKREQLFWRSFQRPQPVGCHRRVCGGAGGLYQFGGLSFQAAQAFNATLAQITSWMWALGVGMACARPCLRQAAPAGDGGLEYTRRGGAGLGGRGRIGQRRGGFPWPRRWCPFMVCAALITLSGLTGLFERLMNRIPMAIASALLAGVLARFGLQAFAAAQTACPGAADAGHLPGSASALPRAMPSRHTGGRRRGWR